MIATKIPLDLIRIASPCKANWQKMTGDEHARFCGECSQYVYNLSELTKEEAEALVMAKEGKLCISFYKRPDGTMMTKDCPVGWQSAKRRLALFGAATATVLVGALGLSYVGSRDGDGRGQSVRESLPQPVQRVWDWFFPRPPLRVLGEMCLPPQPPAGPAAPRN